jgi:hypothetical protein
MMYLNPLSNVFNERFDTGDNLINPGAAERDFCMITPVRLLLFLVLAILFASCSSNSALPTSNQPTVQTAVRDVSGMTKIGGAAKFGAMVRPQTEIVAICNMNFAPLFTISRGARPTLAECRKSFEMAQQTLRPDKKIYIFDEMGLLDHDTDTQMVFLDQRIRPLYETYQFLEQWARDNSYQEVRARRDSRAWSEPVGFKFSNPRTEILAVCNLHRKTFTLKDCQDSYAQANYKLNIGEKFFLYGEDGILWEDVLVKHEDYATVHNMPEIVAKTSYPSSPGVQHIRVKAGGKSWSDPITLNMHVLRPSQPTILQVCSHDMRSCTPQSLTRSEAPFLIDSIGLAAWEQDHMWLETIINQNLDLIACYPLSLALRSGADHCKLELHVPTNYPGGLLTFRSRLANVLGPSEWSDAVEVELDDGIVLRNVTVVGSGSSPNARIAAYSSFYGCDETVANREGNFVLSIPTKCAPDGATLKIVSVDEEGYVRKAVTLDASGINQVNMIALSPHDPREEIIFLLALFEPWTYARLIFYDKIRSFRNAEAEEFLRGNLDLFAGFISNSRRVEAKYLQELADQHNSITHLFWFVDRDDPNEIQKDIDKTGTVSTNRLDKWIEKIESYQDASDEIMVEMWAVVNDLQRECQAFGVEAPLICTEDFADRSRRLRSLYEAANHPGTR